MNERRYDIDWLRVFATYLLFFFHVGKVFDVPPFYHLKNGELSEGLGFVTAYIHQWHMPLFFLLAGWSLHGSLLRRGGRGVLGERVKRIFVPFVFGSATLCIGLGYVEHVLMEHAEMGFFEFVPKFFTSFDYFTWGHLWFLIYLFTFTLLYFPFFKRVAAGKSAIGIRQSAIVYAPLPFLILAQLVLRIWWGGFQNLVNDWGNFTYYSAFLWMGFLLGRYPGLYEAVLKERKRAGWTALAASAVFLYFQSHAPASDVGNYLSYYIPGTILGYTFIIAVLGWAHEHLQFRNRALDYLAESALPVYILHQEGIVFPGWYITNLDAPLPVKFVLLLATAVAVTMLVYHFLVRPIAPVRFLFGMKARRRAVVPAPVGDLGGGV